MSDSAFTQYIVDLAKAFKIKCVACGHEDFAEEFISVWAYNDPVFIECPNCDVSVTF